MAPVFPSALEFHSLLVGDGDQACRFARALAESLPVPSPSQAAEIIEICERGGVRCKSFPDTSAPTLRLPHFTAHPIGIFGGGTDGFPGEFKLASYGVLLFRDIDCFRPEVVAEIATRLAQPQSVSFPRVLIHASTVARIPAAISSLGLQSINLAEAG